MTPPTSNTATPPGITLAIESSNPGGRAGAAGVCIGRVGDGGAVEVLAHRPLTPASRHDDALMPAIAAVCEEAGIAPREIARVAVSVGPGGFTGVRIGVTTAKMIAEATGAACVGVPTAEAVALGVAADAPRPVHVLLAWKRETVWRQVFDGMPLAPCADGTIINIADAAPDGAGTIVADPALSERLGERGGTGARFVCPTFDPRAVLGASAGRAAVDAAALLPLYPREPEAVTNWRILKGS